MVGTNQTAEPPSCCLSDVGSCAKTLGFCLQHGEHFEFCPPFSRCRSEVLEKEMDICYPGHLSLSFVLPVARNSTNTSEGKELKTGLPV